MTVLLFVLLCAWIGFMAAVSLASAGLGVCMIAGFNPFSLLPYTPYWCGALFAVSLIAFSVLSLLGVMRFSAFLPRFARLCGGYRRDRPELPAKAAYCDALVPRCLNKLRKTASVSLAVFIVYWISGYVVSAVSAETLGFWHKMELVCELKVIYSCLELMCSHLLAFAALNLCAV